MLRFPTHCSLFLPALILAVSGCSAIDPPTGYVKVKDQKSYDLKAVSARGNVIALKSRPNEDKTATLDFWSQAVEYQKVDLDGMKLATKEPIKSKGGLDGVLFNFEAGEGQSRISYLVALYVTPMKIYTVEATGPTKAITEDLGTLRSSMLSLRQ